MSLRSVALGVATTAAIGLTGCDRGEVTAYNVPKEAPVAQRMPATSPGADPHAGMAMTRPTVTWGELPAGWTDNPQSSGMRLASFAIAADAGQSAEMAIIPMGGFAGTEEQLVNMWRMQLGLPELANTTMEGQSAPIIIGGIEGRIYEMSGNAQDVPTRMMVASVTKDGVNYFFKLIGHESVVAAEKDPFLNFMKSVEFTDAETVAAAPLSSAPTRAPAGQHWDVPETWNELPATQFLLAKYQVPADGGTVAEVTVSKLGGDAGGMLPNVNRWRGQLALEPVDEMGLSQLVSAIRAGSVDATLVELEGTDMKSGTPARMLAVIVPLPNETWFFKMTGPVPVMETKADEFRAFVNATRF